ncbi:hypothetical protein WJX81_001251 [Elliptochloris bilobata]|uniref:Zeta toxin domain-containing protein n=1 Tax=Elliptochloris bilobata TaxID=381761 RepID=A0AAW1RDP6_9CHLO
MGCKLRVAHKATKSLFQEVAARLATSEDSAGAGGAGSEAAALGECGRAGVDAAGRSVLTLGRREWEGLVLRHLAVHTDRLVAREDFALACSVREQRRSVTVLLAGTSGTGKSTLAGLLAARLGITTMVSTDSVRNMLRSFAGPADDPLLWASTYQAGEHVTDAAAAAAAARRGAKQGAAPLQRMDSKQRTMLGYKAQSGRVVETLERLVGGCEARRESLVVEGVHLSLNFVVRLMQRHPSIVPFLIHISNEAKHRERFAVRAKYMALEPVQNRYVAHLRSIRAIQEYLVRRAERHAIPCVDNTNVDRSVAAIHATVFGCLRRLARGEALLEAGSKAARAVVAEYAAATAATWSSKGALEAIRAKVAAGGRMSDSDQPSTSTASPLGPRSELGEAAAAAADDERSFFDVAESDLASSEGAPSVPEGGSSDEGEALGRMAALQAEEGSLADPDHDEQDEEEGTSPKAAPAARHAHRSNGLA